MCWEESLEKEMATDSSILAWKIPWVEGYSPWSHEDSDMTYQLRAHTRTMQLLFLIYISNHILISSINKLILPLHKPSKSLGLNMKIKLCYLCRGAKFATPTFLWHVHYFELKTIKVPRLKKTLSFSH